MDRLRAGFLESDGSTDIGVSFVGSRFGCAKSLLTSREALFKCAKLSGRYPQRPQGHRDAWSPRGATICFNGVSDYFGVALITLITATVRLVDPMVEARLAHTQELAHAADRPLIPMSMNETISHDCSIAKKAAAFF
jgi:hypothetical protein